MNRFEAAVKTTPFLLMEGAVGQRLEREYGLSPDPDIGYAPLIYTEEGRCALATIYESYLRVAREEGLPVILLTNTRRVNKDRHACSRYADREVIQDYADFLRSLAEKEDVETYIGGMTGCAGDAYTGEGALDEAEAEDFHNWQMERFTRADIDFLFAAIMPAVPEIVGMAKAMAKTNLPYLVSLMLRRDGHLPDGHTIDEAIAATDEAASRLPLLYMTNCVHPLIAEEALKQPFNRTALVRRRFSGIQANAACFSPEELDGSDALRTSEPEELAQTFVSLHQLQPLKLVGGCCGTDERHIRSIARAMKKEYRV